MSIHHHHHTLSFSKNLPKIVDFAQVMMTYHFEDSQHHFNCVKHITKLLTLKYNAMFPSHPLPMEDLDLVCIGASLHDIGLVAIPDHLLRKTGPLSAEEKQAYKDHVLTGARIIDQMSDIIKLSEHERAILHDICLYHHERHDGNGYPEGIRGEDIPLHARIVSVAEVYAALTEKNYSAARSHEEAMNMIMEGKCGVFDPEVLECMKKASADLQTLLECASNEERSFLLQNTYGSNRRSYWIQKRIFDVVVTSIAVLVLSPLFLLLALIIFLDDPKGSPIFCQTRMGRHKKPFKMYKFRTMYVDAEERLKEVAALNERKGPVFKIQHDPRVTRFGSFLRKTSLDELPQLFNVLKGDMTLVGPRPPLPREVEQYSRYDEMRLSVTPGLTCIWQVQPKRDKIEFEQWMDMDIAYIGTRSLWQDIKLLFQTALAVLHLHGS